MGKANLIKNFRKKANECFPFLYRHIGKDDKDYWACICSCMDWIEVGLRVVEKADLDDADNFIKSMKLYSYISAIDIVCEAVQKLHWAIFQNKEKLFENDDSCFATKPCNITDNKFFKEVRACFGAHPVNLNTLINEDNASSKPQTQKRYASYTYHAGGDCWNVHLYSENPTGSTIYVKINTTELKAYFDLRYNYLAVLIKKIDELWKNFSDDAKTRPIEKSDDPIRQLEILKEENIKRLNNESFDDIITQMLHFLNTDFSDKKNEKHIQRFRGKVVAGIRGLYNNIQNISFRELSVSKLLNPRQPCISGFGYEYSALYSTVFTKHEKHFFTEELTRPLVKYLAFEYSSFGEFYWLVVIAMNLAQKDWQEDFRRNDEVASKRSKKLMEYYAKEKDERSVDEYIKILSDNYEGSE